MVRVYRWFNVFILSFLCRPALCDFQFFLPKMLEVMHNNYCNIIAQDHRTACLSTSFNSFIFLCRQQANTTPNSITTSNSTALIETTRRIPYISRNDASGAGWHSWLVFSRARKPQLISSWVQLLLMKTTGLVLTHSSRDLNTATLSPSACASMCPLIITACGTSVLQFTVSMLILST